MMALLYFCTVLFFTLFLFNYWGIALFSALFFLEIYNILKIKILKINNKKL